MRDDAILAHELLRFVSVVHVDVVFTRRLVDHLTRDLVEHAPQKAWAAHEPMRLDAARSERFG